MTFAMPPRLENAAGQERGVGFEFELAGLDLPATARVVQELFGGEIRQEQTFIYTVEGTSLGDFKVEADSSFLKDRKWEEPIGSWVAKVTAGLVPNEIVTPPVKLSRLGEMERLRAALHGEDAKGTRSSLLAGFGMHLNPEAPGLDAPTLLAHLRAFMALYSWIFQESDIDLTRRILPYIDDFPEDYVSLVLDPGYAPDLAGLIDDYMTHTPTRNRPLDMLPLFAFVDEDRVKARAAEPALVKKRPTFHYRLPNCSLEDPAWRVAADWNRWVEVERLAADPEKLRRMCVEMLATGGDKVNKPRRQWAEATPRWLS